MELVLSKLRDRHYSKPLERGGMGRADREGRQLLPADAVAMRTDRQTLAGRGVPDGNRDAALAAAARASAIGRQARQT